MKKTNLHVSSKVSGKPAPLLSLGKANLIRPRETLSKHASVFQAFENICTLTKITFENIKLKCTLSYYLSENHMFG